MTFRPDAVEEFKALFESKKALIAGREGCTHLELWQDVDNRCVFFTYSLWTGPEFLEAYRHSELFAEVWARTKILFDARPEAWSTEAVSVV